eukprot:TRINITY_DN16193_c0_g1_i2.p1 TRINITY_DN16193_c0_g1~~TRINITY_DN16193_c0_g1_i2.p1  ORF type:complete len:1263 (-),score=250.08 TRINITY_DN16193_c0_g1_i2:900-4298(-)
MGYDPGQFETPSSAAMAAGRGMHYMPPGEGCGHGQQETPSSAAMAGAYGFPHGYGPGHFESPSSTGAAGAYGMTPGMVAQGCGHPETPSSAALGPGAHGMPHGLPLGHGTGLFETPSSAAAAGRAHGFMDLPGDAGAETEPNTPQAVPKAYTPASATGGGETASATPQAVTPAPEGATPAPDSGARSAASLASHGPGDSARGAAATPALASAPGSAPSSVPVSARAPGSALPSAPAHAPAPASAAAPASAPASTSAPASAPAALAPAPALTPATVPPQAVAPGPAQASGCVPAQPATRVSIAEPLPCATAGFGEPRPAPHETTFTPSSISGASSAPPFAASMHTGATTSQMLSRASASAASLSAPAVTSAGGAVAPAPLPTAVVGAPAMAPGAFQAAMEPPSFAAWAPPFALAAATAALPTSAAAAAAPIASAPASLEMPASVPQVLESLERLRETMSAAVPPPPPMAPYWPQTGGADAATHAVPPPVAPEAAAANSTRSVSVQAEEPWPQFPGTGGLGGIATAGSLEEQAVVRSEFERIANALCGQLLPELHAKREALTASAQGIDAQRSELRKRCAEAEREGREEFEALRGHLASVETLKLAVLDRERGVRSQLVEGIDGLARRLQQARSGFLSLEAMAAFVREAPELRATAETLRSRAASLPRVEVPVNDVPFEARARDARLRQLAVAQHLMQAKDLALWRLEQQRRQLLQEGREAANWLGQLELLLEKYSESLSYTCYFCSEPFSAPVANTRCLYNSGDSSGRAIPADPRVPAHLWGTCMHFWVAHGWSQHAPLYAPQTAAQSAAAVSAPSQLMPSHQAHQQALSAQPPHAQAMAAPPPMQPQPVQLQHQLQPPSQQQQYPQHAPVQQQQSRGAWPPPPELSYHYSDSEAEQFRAFMRSCAVPSTPSRPSLSPRAFLRQWEDGPRGRLSAPPTPMSAAAVAATDTHLRQIAMLCEQRGVDARNAFRAFDANGDGLVSPQEFIHAIARLGLSLSGEEAANLLARLDTNADGMVSYDEFLSQLFQAVHDPATARIGPALVEHASRQDPAASSLWQRVARAFQDRGVPLRQVFALFDADGDGVISRQELVEAFRLMRLGLVEADVERMLRDIDINQDGKVNIHEFINRLQT